MNPINTAHRGLSEGSQEALRGLSEGSQRALKAYNPIINSINIGLEALSGGISAWSRHV